ncbi:putative short-chain dehydrogenase [Xylariaceae sp. FL0255]|nr:putative short-chain dehydrogenase [Xylariaceae sp. FL0255]
MKNYAAFTLVLFPPALSFTEKDLTSLTGKVFVVTGTASGVGFELEKMLYLAGGTVYIGAGSASRCHDAIEKIKSGLTNTERGNEGVLKAMVCGLADLSTVKPAVDELLRQETRLDGHELEMVTNCIGSYLLTKLLEPILVQTAASSRPFGVRVVFVTALMEFYGPSTAMSQPGDNYMQTKVGGTWLAAKWPREQIGSSVHPGASARIGMKMMFKGPVYGPYSELFAAFSPILEEEYNGGYVLAWRRVAELPDYIRCGLKSETEGGTGGVKMFVEYCEREIVRFQ